MMFVKEIAPYDIDVLLFKDNNESIYFHFILIYFHFKHNPGENNPQNKRI